MFAMSAASAVITIIAQQKGGAVNSLEQLGIGVRTANAIWAYGAYIVKMIWPSNLAVPYPHPKNTLPAWQVIAAGAAIITISILTISQAKRRPYLAVGWYWYLITIAPVIGLIQVGCQGMADRYTYMPLIGIFIIIAYGIKVLNTKIGKTCVATVSAVIILSLALVSHAQVEVWKNSHTLFNHAIDCTQNNYIAHNNLGAVLADEGKSNEAVKHYRVALSIEPNYSTANTNLGVWLTKHNRLDEAIYYFQKALKSDPNSSSTHNGLGVALAKKGNYSQALKEFYIALKLNPESNSAKQNLTVIKYLIAAKTGRAAKNTQPD
jgi:Tfp pilus assembly protein PilF